MARRNPPRSASPSRACCRMNSAASPVRSLVRTTCGLMGARCRRSNGAMSQAAFLEVTLVVFFGAIELRRRLDLGHDQSTEAPALVHLGFRGFRRGALFRGVIE